METSAKTGENVDKVRKIVKIDDFFRCLIH